MTIRIEAFEGAQLPVRHMPAAMGRGELDPIADGERPSRLAIEGDAGQAPRVVGDLTTDSPLNGQPVVGAVDLDDPRVAAGVQTEHLDALRVPNDVPHVVAIRPGAIDARKVLASDQHGEGALLPVHVVGRLQLAVNGRVEVAKEVRNDPLDPTLRGQVWP